MCEIFTLILEKHPDHHLSLQPRHPPETLEPDEPGHRVRHHPQLRVLAEEDSEARVGHLHVPARRDQRGCDPGARARADPARDEERVEASQLLDEALQVKFFYIFGAAAVARLAQRSPLTIEVRSSIPAFAAKFSR